MRANLRQGWILLSSCGRLLVWALATTCLLFTLSCGGGGSSDSTPLQDPSTPPPPPPTPPSTPMDEGFDATAMLTNLADNIIARNYTSLVTALNGFAAEDAPLGAYCSAIGSEEEADALASAREDWNTVINEIQRTELHVIGPALANGEALRQRILSYSAGPISTCGIDQSAALVADENVDFNITSRSLNQRGFGAIEYLLFNDSLDHTCAAAVPATMGWAELDDDVKKDARCDLAVTIASDAAAAADLISTRWGEFREEFVAEGNTGTTLQLVTDAIFAIDLLVKDDKLSVPLGIHDDCSARACPESVESKYAKNSLANIGNNTSSFLELFQGGEGSGFDDLIDEAGFPEVSERFVTSLNAAIAAIGVAENSLYDEALAIDNSTSETSCTNAFANPDGGDPSDGVHGCRIAGLLKRVTDDLKIDFVTIVEVSIPGSAQSDND